MKKLLIPITIYFLTTSWALAEQAQEDLNKVKIPSIREEAFKELLNKKFPLKPEQIIEMHRELDKSQAAVHTSPTVPPQPVTSTITVDLSPGATHPVVRLATGFVTSMVFVDSTGQPWPVADYSLGNPRDFNISWDNKTNALFVQNTKSYSSTNLALRLANLDTPIIVSLVTGQKEVDYRVDLQILKHGPNATAPLVADGMPNASQPILLSVLDGVPPQGSKELQVADNFGRAWLYNNKLIFRTKLTILSPAWIATVASIDGTRVYELTQTPLILASQNGTTVKVRINGL